MDGLSQNDYKELMQEGYSIAEINEAMREVEQEELQKSFSMSQNQRDPRSYSMNSAFAQAGQDNLIKWQLELDNILERAEHILRGDQLVFEMGHIIWKPNHDTKNNILNEYGVQEVMRILSMYLNRNTILGDYNEDEIAYKVLDFGREINDLFFMKLEDMGLTVTFQEAFQKLYKTEDRLVFSQREGMKVAVKNANGMVQLFQLNDDQIKQIESEREMLSLEKRKNYPMLIREIVDTVHSAYTRAKFGGERRSLREARSVTQTEPLNAQMMAGMGMGMPQQKEKSIFNPLRFFSKPR
jgi:hypothetical protein